MRLLTFASVSLSGGGMAKKTKRVRIGEGELCPSCRSRMTRMRHPEDRKLKPRQFYQWDVCRCGRVQHYDAFRVSPSGESPASATGVWAAPRKAKRRDPGVLD
jgi:hypothetical protein